MLIFKRVIFALISALTLYIGNVSNLPPKRGGRPTPPTPPPYLRPCTVQTHDRHSNTCGILLFGGNSPSVSDEGAEGQIGKPKI